MYKLNIFLENTYENLDFDEVLLSDNIKKMAEYLFADKSLLAKSCISAYKADTISFDIVLVNNDEIHRINKEYRQKDSPTDVITFAIFADSPEEEKYILDGEINLGEIIVSVDKIKTQAQENNVTFLDEMYFIISHGILHLLGFDHQSDGDYNFMVDNQNKAKAVVL